MAIDGPVNVYGALPAGPTKDGRKTQSTSPRTLVEPLDKKMNLRAVLCMRKIAAEQKKLTNARPYARILVRNQLPKL
jgi:hypothetical protein